MSEINLNQFVANRADPFGSDYTNNSAEAMPRAWAAYGYPNSLTFAHYKLAYERMGAARGICVMPVDETWSQKPRITDDSDNDDESEFELAVKKLDRKLRSGLFRAMRGADERQRVGRYAGLLIVIADGKTLDAEIGTGEVIELKPFFEDQLKPNKWNLDTNSVDYGHPITYDLVEKAVDGEPTRQPTIHHSRLVMWAEGSDDGTIFGRSCLEPIYNTIITLDKLEGAGGTGFWRNARGAQAITFEGNSLQTVQDMLGAKTPSEIPEKLSEAVKGIGSDFEAVLALMNAKRETIVIALDNPEPFVRVCWDNIAAGTRYPETIIRGHQTGERASTSDQEQAAKTTTGRRDNFATPMIRKVIDKLIAVNALPDVEFDIVWPSMFEPSLSGKIDMFKVLTDAVRSIGGEADAVKLAKLVGIDAAPFEDMDLEGENQDDDESDTAKI
jgi:hypothetical protein